MDKADLTNWNGLYDYRNQIIETEFEVCNIVFDKDLLFQYCIAKKIVKFSNCEFMGDIIFGSDEASQLFALLEQDIYFEGCVFHGQILMDGVTCLGSLFMKNCQSVNSKEYGMSLAHTRVKTCIDIQDCSFRSSLRFNSTIVENANCSLTRVCVDNSGSIVDFTSAYLAKQLNFEDCNFNCGYIYIDNFSLDKDFGAFYINNSTFCADTEISFKLAKVGSLFHIQESSVCSKSINFSQIQSKNDIIITDVDFKAEENQDFSRIIVGGDLLFEQIRLSKNGDLDFSDLTVTHHCSFLEVSNVESLSLDLSYAKIGGDLSLDCLSSPITEIDMRELRTRGLSLMQTQKACAISYNTRIRVDNLAFERLDYLNYSTFIGRSSQGKLLESAILEKMLPVGISSFRQRRKSISGEGILLESGQIPFLRRCQNLLAESDDNMTEANNIWRLRNRIRIAEEHRNVFSFVVSIIWNYFTDYGLSSRRIVLSAFYLVLSLFAINIYVFNYKHDYYMLPVQQTIAECFGQSLLQFISSINFTAKNLVDAEEFAPHWYQVLIVLYRILGFLITSILVGSSADLWKGKNK